jgi:hypothetical protein
MCEATEKVIKAAGTGIAFEKAERLCCIIKEDPGDASPRCPLPEPLLI